MITVADYLDAVSRKRMGTPIVLSPEAMFRAERVFRENAEAIAKMALERAKNEFVSIGARWRDVSSSSLHRQERLKQVLTDTDPLVEPQPEKLPGCFSSQ